MATTILTPYVDSACVDVLGQGGKFFTVVFAKESGELRHMVCRLAVTKGLKGSGKAQSRTARAVWDSVKREYRSFRYDRVLFAVRGDLSIVSLHNMGMGPYVQYLTDKEAFLT